MKYSIKSELAHMLFYVVVTCITLLGLSRPAHAIASGELAWSIGYDPSTLDPAKADDTAAETVRYLTGGVLLRLNRSSLTVEPALAESWTTSKDGHLVTLRLRHELRFSDGSPLSSKDVVATLRRVLSPGTGAPSAEEFLVPGKVTVQATDPWTIQVHLPERIASLGAVFDEIAIEPAERPSEGRVSAGPFVVSEYKRGQYLRLVRNPFYWKRDTNGVQLPYLSGVRLDILNSRETEELRFVRDQYAFLDLVPPEGFDSLNRRLPGTVHDLGASLNTEQMWFNQAGSAPLPSWEKAWYANQAFRQAVSLAIHRTDLARIAFAGHATPANGFISPTNSVWYDHALPPVTADPAAAMRLLTAAGFQKTGGLLVDHDGHPVKFSILTNAGNRSRERMAALIQQDLSSLGMQVNIVTLDFPALIERLMHTSDYQAALLGLSDIQPDPSSMMNIWLSSSPNHQWNPAEKIPATPWEAEIDRAMHQQAETNDPKVRKASLDRVQELIAQQVPFIYLVYPNVLCAASSSLEGVRFTVLQPDVISNIDSVRIRRDHP